ncbi:hypothetical protein NLI96_g11085 [Meripilus lineatus]|uniref:Uncharacterized protein n=1 Tax=Meripilus lineatus TaxID=2056292 RepID=A0AAD5UUU3_9APHY|nr:hypothetical protein NLI96_g11085 [Physisporinus lineatus]
MSTLKHTIRQHQAQLHSLENTLLRGPRPLPPGILNSPPALSPSELDSYMSISPPYSPPNPGPSSYPANGTPKLQKRNSFEVLSGLAGPDSSLPLPRRDSRGSLRPQFGVNGLNGAGEENGIKEGIPMGMSPSKRASSPTRTLSST